MTATECIKEINVGANTLRLLLQNQIPLVECEGQLFQHVWLLIQHHPLLSQSSYIDLFAEISNFLWKGLQFQYIEQVSDYQRFYDERVEWERKCPSDLFQFRLTDYKIFDVSVMHPPRLEDDRLLYFVYNGSTGLPYRVQCPFPYNGTSTLVHYQVLPLKDEGSFS